jgi:NADPH:quinone reductase-like Zn-dependent oxidoreductase
MRAIVWTRYGPPEGLRLEQVSKPTPAPHEILIRVRATAVAAGDCELRALRVSLGLRILVRLLMGPTKPRRKILGQEFAGEVEAIGVGVTQFKPGDPIFGTTGFRFGAYAEYLCLAESSGGSALATKPSNMSFEEAATVPTGALEALHFLRQVPRLKGKRVLIIGAGGGIGMFAVQLAKGFGAEVTGVDTTSKLEMLLGLGADHTIDFTQQEVPKRGMSYDVIFDVVGKSSYADCIRALAAEGHYLLGNPRPTARLHGFWTSRTSRKQVVSGAAKQRSEDLAQVRGLIEAGRIRTVVDRTFPLEELPEAHRAFESGKARGRIAITVAN